MKTFMRWLHENAKLIFAIAVILYSVIKTLWKNVVHNIWVRKEPDIKFESKIQFCKYLKNYQVNEGFDPTFGDFRTIFNIFPKLNFALKFYICLLIHPNNMHKNFFITR